MSLIILSVTKEYTFIPFELSQCFQLSQLSFTLTNLTISPPKISPTLQTHPSFQNRCNTEPPYTYPSNIGQIHQQNQPPSQSIKVRALHHPLKYVEE